MWKLGVVVLAVIAGCKKGPSCEERKKEAANAIREARIAASDTTPEQTAFDAASSKLEELRAFQVKLTANVSEVRSAAGCDSELICCKKAEEWIAANAAAEQDQRPLIKLPLFGDVKVAPPALAKHLTAYDAAATKLAAALQKGPTATLEEVTPACTEANTAINLVRSSAPNTITSAVEAAEADRNSTSETLKLANGRATIYLAWEDAIAKNAKFDVPAPVPSESVKITEAKAKAKSVQSCLK
jgi:hypothetical protein